MYAYSHTNMYVKYGLRHLYTQLKHSKQKLQPMSKKKGGKGLGTFDNKAFLNQFIPLQLHAETGK